MFAGLAIPVTAWIGARFGTDVRRMIEHHTAGLEVVEFCTMSCYLI